jgi:hypothetical protein
VEGSGPRGDEVDTALESTDARHGESMLMNRREEKKKGRNGP